ncbi:MAG: hypothetical protein COB65_12990 [Thalassobium sp.]|nr:MAG: hypothetical protein COB65_12990 [Thalassobium sp.]|tara:strand:- start:317 stop:511 length:195 start_codon:yes stop_codon:yes gene_type:complete
MTALFFSSFPRLTWPARKAAPKVDDSAPVHDVARRKIVSEMIAAGACDSEYGMQMLMSVYPDEF